MSTRKRPASTGDRHEFPETEARIGEDPGRYLDADNLALAAARIRGIRSVERVEGWLEAEVEIGPRREVIAALNQRKAALQEDEADVR